MDEKELILFLEAVKETTNNNESDLEEVKSELEVRVQTITTTINRELLSITCHWICFVVH